MDKPSQLTAFTFRAAHTWLRLGVLLLAFSSCANPLADEFKKGKNAGPKPNVHAPTISAVGNVTVAQDESFVVDFTVGDLDGPLDCQQSIYFSASNYTLFPPTLVARLGSYPNCRLSFRSAQGFWGSSSMQIQASDGVNAASTSFTVTVTEGTTTPTIANASANEGSAMAFVIRLSQALPEAKTFTYATSNGTATAGTHYSSTAGSVTFSAGETTKTVNVPTTLDGEFAPSRAFTFTVTNGGSSVSAQGTILNTDGAPTASAAAVGVSEGTALVFTVNLSRPSATNTTVTYATSNGTAVAGTNYTATAGTLIFTPGQTAQTLTVNSQNDSTFTSNLTFTLSLTANSVTNTATGTIADSLGPPTASAANVTANEGSNLTFTVNLSQAIASSLNVTYATSNGTAVSGTNYTSTSGTLTFAAGQTSRTITVASLNDGVFTPNQTFTLSLTVNAVTNIATGTVANINGAPTASALGVTANEGSNLVFTVALDRASSTATTVSYATINGTAIGSTNFVAASGTLNFSAGETSKTLTISSLADNVFSPDLGFTLSLTANSVTNTATGTIANTETAPVPSVANTSANEGSPLSFTVTLNRASATSTTVSYATANGTALSGTNYTAAAGSLNFNAGETSKIVNVTSLSDSAHSPDLAFTLSATANSVTSTGTGSIVNTDSLPIATVGNISANEGSNLVFTVSLDRISTLATTISYATSDGTAAAGVNYVAASGNITIPAGQTSGLVTIASVDDATYDVDQTFTLSVNANSTLRTATGTVVNTDLIPTVSLAAASSSIAEGVAAGFNITLTNASASDVQVNYATVGGTATSGIDFAAGSGTATIAAGSLSTNVSIATYDDNVDEQNEAFTFEISSALNATLGTATAAVTIQDTTLHFDFTLGSLPSGLTFARTGAATYYDAIGILQTAATGVPRFDYNPTGCGGSCTLRGLLIEEARTNLILQSANYGTTWVSNGVTLTANAATSPGGTVSAYSVQSSSGVDTNTNHISQQVTLTSSTDYTLSFYVKNSTAERSVYELEATNSGATGKTVTLDWTGPVPTASSGRVTALPNDWYRVSLSFTANASDGGSAEVRFYPSTTLDTGTVHLWGGQLEAGSTATSYIATTTTALTRGGDSISVNSFGTWFSSSAWTAIIDLSRSVFEASSSPATPVLFSSCDATSGTTCSEDSIQALHIPSDNTFRGRASVAAAIVATSNYTNAANLEGVILQVGVSQTLAGALQTVVNGSAATASSSATMPNTNNFVLGSSGLAGGYANQVNGHLRKFTYRSRALTAAQLQAITSD
jgi:hypothetical protein